MSANAAAALPLLAPSFSAELSELALPWSAAQFPAPELLVLNAPLVTELGGDTDLLASPRGAELLVGAGLPAALVPVAQGYAGHQFGGWSPKLGDGRALLLGELLDTRGERRDVHLKGSGRTPFARGGDGKAAVGPMLREYLIGEAMHALGIPTTRALAVLATGEAVQRETLLPGAILARVAASHLRVGTFQYAATTLADPALLRRLTDYAIARHHPAAAAAAERPALALLDAVVDAQAELIARWMLVGFVHGVMNTDNMTISGETIDYGPCAFLEAYDPETVFSSIDHAGRYAYGNQPAAAQWNLARLAEALLPLIDPGQDTASELATAVLTDLPERFGRHWRAGMQAKLGLAEPAEQGLYDDLLSIMHEQQADYTATFRALAVELRGAPGALGTVTGEPAAFAAWLSRWRALAPDPDAMDRVNPLYVPRNHLVEEALTQATLGDLAPFSELHAVLERPFTPQPGREAYAAPGPQDPYVTFCGT